MAGSASQAFPERRTALVSIVAAGVLVVLKLGVGAVTGSLGLISVGVESSGDLIAATLTFFVVRLGTESLYTRAGSFNFDQNGFLTDPSGAVVQGWMGGADGTISTNSPVGDIKLPVGQVIAPVSTTTVSVGGNLSATAASGETVSTAIQVIDSLGAQQRISIDFTKSTNANVWNMTVKGPDGTALNGTDTTPISSPSTARGN